jgi:rRNA processing protein Gar1
MGDGAKSTTVQNELSSNRKRGEVMASTMQPRRGYVVEIHGHRVGEKSRTGEILEVLGPVGEHHYLVRWVDGHESLFYPGSTIHAIHHPQ